VFICLKFRKQKEHILYILEGAESKNRCALIKGLSNKPKKDRAEHRSFYKKWGCAENFLKERWLCEEPSKKK